MDTFHGDDDMHCFDDEDDLEHLMSLMSDDDSEEVKEEVTNVEKPKSRTESGTFVEELDAVAKNRKGGEKRKLSQRTQGRGNKRSRKEQSQQENDKTALLEAELKAMKEKMLKMEQLLEEKSGSQQKPVAKVNAERADHTPLRTHVNGARIAHQPHNKNVPSMTLKRTGKELLSSEGSTNHQRNNAKKILANEKATEKECVTETYSGLRIRNPLVSSQTMKERMANRKMIRIPVVCSHVKGGDIAGDWVTIGVVVSKMPPKDTAKGGRFCMLRISDLSSQSAVLALFLFSDACKVHWKLQPGEVVAILNANLRPDDRGGPGRYTLSISNPDKLMRMGMSHDFTQCKGTVRATGKPCTNFAKRSEGSCCEYHISQEYRSKMSSRMEFQSGYGPTVDGIRKLKQKVANDNVFYGGDVFHAPKQPETAPKKKQINRLFTPGATEAAAHVSQELTKEKISSRPTAEESAVFKELLQLQSAGARNFNQYRNKEKPVSSDEKKAQVLSASEVIREQSGSANVVSSPPIAPCLGRGSFPGADIDLSTTKKSASAIAKQKAIALLGSNPIKREDPNAIPGQKCSDKKKELIAERVKECYKENKESGNSNSSGNKKINWDEMERVMSKKSSHDWEAKEEERAKENFYFQQLEQKEAMEEKMKKIEKLSVKVVTCKECGYTAEHASERCKKDGHHLTHRRSEKRFFTCSSCNTHTISYDRYPSKPCKKCNGTSFKKAGMFKERTGPKLDSEKLLLRGEEEKFLTSLR